MKSVRVIFALVALSALPLMAAAAQGNSQKCKNAVQAARATAGQRVPAGQAKKDCPDPVPPPAPPPPPPAPVPPPPPPPPPPSSPPSGPHQARGVVFEDLDGDGRQDVFSSEMGIEGWTVNLYWNGQVIASTSSLSDGSFIFQNLGNTTYSVCLGAPPAGQGPYNQTLPVGGSGCSGAGYTFMFNSQFMTWSVNNFGEQLQVP